MLMLKRGDRLPPVAVVQALLRSLLPDQARLAVDGEFGPITEAAVRAFQRRERVDPDGRVGSGTWAALTQHTQLAVRDIVDVFDPLLLESASTVGGVGSQPIVFGGGSNAIGWIVPGILGSGVRNHTLTLLRFHGHGNRGQQVTGYGTGCHVIVGVLRGQPLPPLRECTPARVRPTQAELAAYGQARSHSSLSLHNLDLPDVHRILVQLGSLFSPWGSIELRGCQVAGGLDGHRFVRRLADVIGRPVTAATQRQLVTDAVRFDGPVVTGFPRGETLRSWAHALPPILAST